MASSTLVRKVMLQIAADDGDTEAKLDLITAKAKELGKLHPELEARINIAAASAKVGVLRDELKELGKPVEPVIAPKADVNPAKARIDELQLSIDRLRAKAKGIPVTLSMGADELKIAGLEAELKGLSEKSGEQSGTAFGDGFSMMSPQVIVPAVALAMASLPAVAATAGAGAGIAFGAALLVGTKKVQGPLYGQFHDLTQGLTAEIRTSALPLVAPLAKDFRMIGADAQALKPLLTGVFRALGPLVAPLTKGLEGLVSGPLPGFLSLMKASKPAIEEVSGALRAVGSDVGVFEKDLVPGVTASGKVFGGLLRIVGSLLPVVGTLSSDLAELLAPIVDTLGTKTVPQLAGSVEDVLNQIEPLLPELGQLAGDLLQLATGPMITFIDANLKLANVALPAVIPVANLVMGALDGIAQAADWAFSEMSKIPGMAGLAPHAAASVGGGIAGMAIKALSGPVSVAGTGGTSPWDLGLSDSDIKAGKSPGSSSGSTAATQAQQDAYAKLGAAVTAAIGSGVVATIPVLKRDAAKLMTEVKAELKAGMITQSEADKLFQGISNDLQRQEARVKKDAARLGEALNGALVDALAGSKDATAAKTAVAKLLADVKTAYDDGVISLQQDSKLTHWLDTESLALQGIADRRAYIVTEISKAKALAASTASNVAGGYGLSNFASSGLNGGPANARTIITSLHGDVIQIRQFASNIKKLAREGLDKNYLQQLIAMGPVQGGALAQELAGVALSDIASINKYEHQISTASGGIGKLSAQIQFEGGKAVGQGYLAELEKQQAQLDKSARAMAKAFVDEVRRGIEGHGGGKKEHVLVDVRGGDKEFRAWLKKIIRITGGDPGVVGA